MAQAAREVPGVRIEPCEMRHAKEVELLKAAAAISQAEGRRSVLLWFGVLGSPVAWAGHLVGNYSLEEWFACSKSAKTQGEILGLPVHTMSMLINTAMLAVAVASALVALAQWRRLRISSEGGQAVEASEESTERARWMAFAGVVEGGLFIGIILLGYLPAVTLGVCETTP